MDTILLNLRIGLRMLVKRPGLAAGRLLTVLIIVAAGSAVFTVANVTLLRPLPYPHPDRLLRIYLQPPGTSDFRDANPLHVRHDRPAPRDHRDLRRDRPRGGRAHA